MNATLSLSLDAEVTAAQAGDRDAFARLVDMCGHTVTSIILAIVRDLQACEDIAQDVFLSAWVNLKKLRNPASFLPWLRQTARNRANTWVKERIRERARTCALDGLTAEAVDPTADAGAGMLHAEELQVLYAVLGELPDEAREVVTLYYREGRSTAQVARLLDMREEAVRQRLARARAKLREGMLERFGHAVRASAPAGLTVAVMSALATAAPAASAGTLVGGGKAMGWGLLGKAALSGLPGLLSGLFGVYWGIRRELRDAESFAERRAIVRLGLTAALGVVGTVWAFVITGTTGTLWPSLVAYTGFTALILLLYLVELPRIKAPRYRRARAEDPTAAARQASERFRCRMIALLGVVGGWGGLIAGLWLRAGR